MIATKEASPILSIFGQTNEENMIGTISVPGAAIKKNDTACSIYKVGKKERNDGLLCSMLEKEADRDVSSHPYRLNQMES